MRVASIDGSLRIFSLASTRAVCPKLRRLGTLVLQDALSVGLELGVANPPGVAVGVSAAEVGVGVAAPMVGVGDDEALVGVSDDGDVAVAVDSAVDGMGDRKVVSVVSGAAIVSVGAGEGALIAHPRRSMSIRITTRMAVTTDLNRS
jgi:hypothetical protein